MGHNRKKRREHKKVVQPQIQMPQKPDQKKPIYISPEQSRFDQLVVKWRDTYRENYGIYGIGERYRKDREMPPPLYDDELEFFIKCNDKANQVHYYDKDILERWHVTYMMQAIKLNEERKKTYLENQEFCEKHFTPAVLWKIMDSYQTPFGPCPIDDH